MKHTMKKRFAVTLLTLAILSATVMVVYAVINFISIELQTSSFIKREYFEMSGSEFFVEDGEIGIGDSAGIDPVITSKASVDMYVFIRVEMPMFTDAEGNDGGLYTLNTDDSWTLVDSYEADGKWIEVYGYTEALAPEASTTALADKLTMVDMSLSDYALITDMDVSMTGYGWKTVDKDGADMDINSAWELIKDAAGVWDTLL